MLRRIGGIVLGIGSAFSAAVVAGIAIAAILSATGTWASIGVPQGLTQLLSLKLTGASDNSMCTGSGVPLICCTGAGAGTCTSALRIGDGTAGSHALVLDGNGTDAIIGFDNGISGLADNVPISPNSLAIGSATGGAFHNTTFYFYDGSTETAQMGTTSFGGGYFQTLFDAVSTWNVYSGSATALNMKFITKTNHSTGSIHVSSPAAVTVNSSGATWTTDLTTIVPAGVLLGVAGRVTTTVGGCAGTLAIDDGTTAGLYATGIALSATTTFNNTQSSQTSFPITYYKAAHALTVRCSSGSFNSTGAIRFAFTYMDMTAPDAS